MYKHPTSYSELISANFDGNMNPFNFNYQLIVKPVFQAFSIRRRSVLPVLACFESLTRPHAYKGTFSDYVSHLRREALVMYRIMWRLRRLALSWLRRVRQRKLIPVNDMDLLMCELTEPLIRLAEGVNHVFLFTPRDIIAIYESALMANGNMIATPMQPENPYNRRRFAAKKSAFIMWRLRGLGVKIPMCMKLFEQSGYSIVRFTAEWRPWLTMNAIRNWVWHTVDETTLMNVVTDIIHSNYNHLLNRAIVALLSMRRTELLERFGQMICDKYAYDNLIIDHLSTDPFIRWFNAAFHRSQKPILLSTARKRNQLEVPNWS
jgi:hypothetical protein